MDPLSIISKDLPIAPVTAAYSEQLQAIGGTAPYTWAVVSGSLPPGMVLSSAGLLTAAIGAIPANATGTYTFRLRARDSVLTDAFHDYAFEVAPKAYGRVPQFLLDPRFRDLLGNLYITPVTREKVERHFFRDLIGATGVTYVHLDRDIQIPDWITPSNDVGLRTVLDSIYVATQAAVKTINAIAPDPAGDYSLVAGTGITLTGQPTGLRIDVVAGSAGGIQEANVEADVASGASQSLVVPSLPDVIEVWFRDEFDSSWDRLSDMNEALTKKVAASVADTWATTCAVGCDITGLVGSYLFTCHYDSTGPVLVLNKYDGESMELLETGLVPLPGPIDGEPLVMVNRAAPYEPIVVAIAGSPKAIVYTEFVDPDNLVTGGTRTNTFLATDADASAIEYEPCEMSGYDANAKQIPGTILDMGGAYEALIAPKISYGGIGNTDCVLLRIPIGAATPVIGDAAGFGSTNADTLDVVFDGSVVPNDVYVLNSTGRWTGGGGTLDLWKLPNAGWTPLPPPPPAGSLPLPPVTWSQNIATLATDGMEVPKAMLAFDLNPSGKDSVNVVYIFDEFLGLPVLPTPIGPPLHTPVLSFDRYDDVSNPLGPTLQGNVVMDEFIAPALDATSDGRFGRWWYSSESASVFFVDSKRTPGRVYTSSALFDAVSLRSYTEDTHSFADPSADITTSGIVRAAHSTASAVGYTGAARAIARLNPAGPFTVLALDSSSKPNPFRTYYDGGTNVVFENESPFAWHIKMEALLNEVDPAPINMSVPCWQLAQAFQNYFNANGFFPSASSNPPGPGGVQGTVWDESETGTTLTSGVAFYPTYYTVTPGQWDMNGGSTASAYYYSVSAAGASTDMWLVFRYALTPSTILAAEAAMAPVLTAGPLPAPGVYTLAQIAAAMSQPSWVTTYSGAPFDKYQYYCFVDAAGTGYYHGWFSENYIHNAQVYGPGAPGVEPQIPFIEKFTMASDAVTGVPTVFTLSRTARYAEVYVNGIAYWQGDDWSYGATLNLINYQNYASPGYTLHMNDRVVIKYLV